MIDNVDDVRETIVVEGTDARKIADALPVLLGQLGIPEDAEGVVAEDYNEIPIIVPLGGAGEIGSGLQTGTGPWLIPVLVGGLLSAMLAGWLFLRVRRRRRSGSS